MPAWPPYAPSPSSVRQLGFLLPLVVISGLMFKHLSLTQRLLQIAGLRSSTDLEDPIPH